MLKIKKITYKTDIKYCMKQNIGNFLVIFKKRHFFLILVFQVKNQQSK